MNPTRSCVHGWKPSDCPVTAECRKPGLTEDERLVRALTETRSHELEAARKTV